MPPRTWGCQRPFQTQLSVLWGKFPEVDCRVLRPLCFQCFQEPHAVFRAAAPARPTAVHGVPSLHFLPAPGCTKGRFQLICQERSGGRHIPPCLTWFSPCRLPQGVSLQDLLSKLGRPFKEYELWALSHACLSAVGTHARHPGDTCAAVPCSAVWPVDGGVHTVSQEHPGGVCSGLRTHRVGGQMPNCGP